jgi:DNA-directed RNA polymerase specialized sigma24 family protein
MLIEQKLIKRIKKKQNKEAANALISYYYKEVYAYVYRQTGNEENEELAKDHNV